MQWFKVVDGGNPDGTAKDRVGLTAGTTYLAKYWNDNFFNIFNALTNAGYTLIDDDLTQITKAIRGGYNATYIYNTSSVLTQTVNDIVLGSDGALYEVQANGVTGDNPVGSITGNWLPLAIKIGNSGFVANLLSEDISANTTSYLPKEGGVLLSDELKVVATGSAVFTNSTNNIALTGVGVGVEVGDVIVVTGSASNNKEFTIEVITNDNNIIVNQAHAGGSTTKSLVNETVAVTVKLLSKWYAAPLGLGQGWVNVVASRTLGTTYPNNTSRAIAVAIRNISSAANTYANIIVSGVTIVGSIAGSAQGTAVYAEIPKGATYTSSATSLTKDTWAELR